jgi:hypothetical protein
MGSHSKRSHCGENQSWWLNTAGVPAPGNRSNWLFCGNTHIHSSMSTVPSRIQIPKCGTPTTSIPAGIDPNEKWIWPKRGEIVEFHQHGNNNRATCKWKAIKIGLNRLTLQSETDQQFQAKARRSWQGSARISNTATVFLCVGRDVTELDIVDQFLLVFLCLVFGTVNFIWKRLNSTREVLSQTISSVRSRIRGQDSIFHSEDSISAALLLFSAETMRMFNTSQLVHWTKPIQYSIWSSVMNATIWRDRC